ncbi:MAG TPA: S41 family peptidase [Microlunatus sp.]
MVPSPTLIGELAALLPNRVEEHYGPGPRVENLRRALAAFAGDRSPVVPGTLAALETMAQTVFRHLELTHQLGLVPQLRSPGWPEGDLSEIRRAGADIAMAQRQPDGSGMIRLTGLAPVQAAGPLLAGAFTLLRDADPITLDLRDNTGGDPATVALIVDWLAGDVPRHLFDVVYRDRVRQWWTAGNPCAEPPTGAVRALIGARTYSSGEALAWVLKDHGLATLVGEPTRGAADHVVPLALAHDVHALIPEAHVVAADGGPTWEGSGVHPDLSAAEAT